MVTVLACWGALIVGGVYMLRAIRSILHGPIDDQWTSIADATNPWRKLPFALLLASLLVFGFFPRLLSDKIIPDASRIVEMTDGTPLPAAADGVSSIAAARATVFDSVGSTRDAASGTDQ